jgi:hypothetical protein
MFEATIRAGQERGMIVAGVSADAIATLLDPDLDVHPALDALRARRASRSARSATHLVQPARWLRRAGKFSAVG